MFFCWYTDKKSTWKNWTGHASFHALMGSSHYWDFSVKLSASLTTANCAALLQAASQKKGKLSLNCPQPFYFELSLIDPKVALDSHTSPASNLMRHSNLFSTDYLSPPLCNALWIVNVWSDNTCIYVYMYLPGLHFLRSHRKVMQAAYPADSQTSKYSKHSQ